MHIKNRQHGQMPREKALQHGISTLSDQELLALFLRTGKKNKSVFVISELIMNTFKNFVYLKNATLGELINIEGIGHAKSLELQAIFEIAQRMNAFELKRVSSIKEAAQIATYQIGSSLMEKLFMIILNKEDQIIYQKVLFMGSDLDLSISPKYILSEVLKRDGDKIYIFHNHPSGISKPSSEDILLTRSLTYYCELLSINLLAHIIVTSKNGYSIIE